MEHKLIHFMEKISLELIIIVLQRIITKSGNSHFQ